MMHDRVHGAKVGAAWVRASNGAGSPSLATIYTSVVIVNIARFSISELHAGIGSVVGVHRPMFRQPGAYSAGPRFVDWG
jgi:hypothetical protein